MRSFTLIYIEQLRGAVRQQNLRRKKKSLQSTTASRCYGNKAAIKKKKGSAWLQLIISEIITVILNYLTKRFMNNKWRFPGLISR